MRRPFADKRPIGLFRQRVLEVRSKCEPEVIVVIDGIEDSDEIIEVSEKELLDNIGLQFDDILVGRDMGDTEVTVRVLRQRVDIDKINQYADFMESRYDVESVDISASREER